MKCRYLYFLLALLLSGCGLLGRSTETKDESRNVAKEQINLNSKTEKQDWKDVNLYNFEHDSLKAAYSFRLWPKGKFIFSPAHGFEGDFDSVSVTATINKSAVISSHAMVKQQVETKNENDYQQKSTSDSLLKREQKKSLPTIKIILTGVILIGIISFWLLRRKL